VGYNFTCARECSLPNEHIGPCDALQDIELLAEAVLETYEDGEWGVCIHCAVRDWGGKAEEHKPDCITHLAKRIMERREQNIEAARQMGVT
jgi:hypothetical protein